MKVFISHVHNDDALASKIARFLHDAGIEVWDDQYILPGDNWAEKVSKALDESEAMVVLLSPAALKSSWVHREIEYALGKEKYSKKLYPVIVGPREMIPKDKLPWILLRLHTIEMPNPEEPDESIKQIVATLLSAS